MCLHLMSPFPFRVIAGICFFHLGEFDRALLSLERALGIINMALSVAAAATPVPVPSSSSSRLRRRSADRGRGADSSDGNDEVEEEEGDHVNSAITKKGQEEVDYRSIERRRILLFISKAKKGVDRQGVNEMNQKRALQRVFAAGQVLGEGKKKAGRPQSPASSVPGSSCSSSPSPLVKGEGRGITGSIYLFLACTLRFIASVFSLRFLSYFKSKRK